MTPGEELLVSAVAFEATLLLPGRLVIPELYCTGMA